MASRAFLRNGRSVRCVPVAAPAPDRAQCTILRDEGGMVKY